MKKRIDVIDFLRGISIISIIFLHVIFPLDFRPSSAYTLSPFLTLFRSFLNFCIVTLVIVSGFSLYHSAKNTKFNFKNTKQFFKKRTKRIVLPWFIYILISIIIYTILALFIPNFSARLFQLFPFMSYQSVLGIPVRWIILKWVIVLFVILGFLFPPLKFIYSKGRAAIVTLILAYLASLVLTILYPVDPYSYLDISLIALIKFSFPILFFTLTFILGWSLVYMLGFYLEDLYSKNKLNKKITNLTVLSIISFIAIHLIYKSLNLSTQIILNKTPPSPYYLTFGLAITFILMTYHKLTSTNKPKKFFTFFSNNSLWIFLWSYLTIIFIAFTFTFLEINIYLKFILESITNLLLLTGIVILQKRFTKLFFQ